MEENFKDPNQLDLFEGKVLTEEQQKLVNKKINRLGDIFNHKMKITNHQERLLLENGFVKGVDFVNDVKITEVTNEYEFDKYVIDTPFKHEITYKRAEGNIYLLYQDIDYKTRELKTSKAFISYEDGKFESYTISGNYRKLKPSTLLEKLKWKNERTIAQYNREKKKKNIKELTLEKYTQLFPEAIVEEHSTYIGRTHYKNLIKIQFKSGSYVHLTLGNEIDQEEVLRKFDKELEDLGIADLLNKFNSQA